MNPTVLRNPQAMLRPFEVEARQIGRKRAHVRVDGLADRDGPGPQRHARPRDGGAQEGRQRAHPGPQGGAGRPGGARAAGGPGPDRCTAAVRRGGAGRRRRGQQKTMGS